MFGRNEKTEDLLVRALDTISDGFAIWDADDFLVLCNSRYREIFPDVADLIVPGVSFEDLLRLAAERGLYDLPGDELEAFIADRLTRHRNPGPPLIQQLTGNRWIQITERRMPDGGTIAVWTDISELKRREQELAQAQKIEAIGQLTGGIAHDFNNLLAVILGNLDLLSNHLSEHPELADFVDRAVGAARRGASLTDRLLAFSRKQSLRPQTTDLRVLFFGMKDLFERTLGNSVLIESEFDEDLWHVRIDPHQLESAMLNLAINSRDAMEGKGRLKFVTKNSSCGRFVEIAVTDTGSGMSPEVAHRAFEPFFTTKKAGRGTGLGLSMVYGFVKQSGGSVVLESSRGKGTTVKLQLPRDDRPASELKNEPHTEDVRARGERLLLVDDNPEVRRLTAAMLADLGYSVCEAADADTALRELEKPDRIDMLVTDVVLGGGMSGPELVSRVRVSKPDFPILYVSGYTQHSSVDAGLLSDQDSLVRKPFRRADLAKSVRMVLNEAQAL